MRFGLPVLVLMAFVAVFADSTPKPRLESLTNWGCEVAPTDTVYPHRTFKARAWAEHNRVRDWNFALAMPEGKKGRRQALMACSDWMDEMDRAEMQKAAGKR